MKKHTTATLLSIFVLAFLFAFTFHTKADAASYSQTKATQNSVTVSWENPVSSYYIVTAYRVYVGTRDSNYNYNYKLYRSLGADQTSIQITGLPAGCEKRIKIEYDYHNASRPENTGTDYFFFYAKTLPGKVTGLKQDRWYYWIKSFNAVWNKQEGADGYEYIVKTNNNKRKASGTTYSSSFSVDKISNQVIYSAQVRAYTTINGKKYYGAWSDPAYFLTQPQITKAKISGTKLSVKWKKVGGATGYDVYVSTKKTKGYKKVKSVSSKASSATVKKMGKKKFSKKKKYYVYIVTKKKVKGHTNKSGRLYYWNTKDSGYGYF